MNYFIAYRDRVVEGHEIPENQRPWKAWSEQVWDQATQAALELSRLGRKYPTREFKIFNTDQYHEIAN